MLLIAPHSLATNVGDYAGYRWPHTECGRPLTAVLIHPDIPDEVFNGEEANLLYSLHKDGLRVGRALVFDSIKRSDWLAGQNLPLG